MIFADHLEDATGVGGHHKPRRFKWESNLKGLKCSGLSTRDLVTSTIVYLIDKRKDPDAIELCASQEMRSSSEKRPSLWEEAFREIGGG